MLYHELEARLKDLIKRCIRALSDEDGVHIDVSLEQDRLRLLMSRGRRDRNEHVAGLVPLRG